MIKHYKKIQILALTLIALTMASFNVDSGERSLASEHSFSGYVFKGQVKAISYDLPVTIKFKNVNNGAQNKFETIKICDYTEKTLETVSTKLQMDQLKEALGDGRLLKVSYNSLFDRCLVGVTDESAKQADFKDIK